MSEIERLERADIYKARGRRSCETLDCESDLVVVVLRLRFCNKLYNSEGALVYRRDKHKYIGLTAYIPTESTLVVDISGYYTTIRSGGPRDVVII